MWCTRRVYNRRTYAQSRLERNSAVRPVDSWVFKFVFTGGASLIRSVRLYPLVSALNTQRLGDEVSYEKSPLRLICYRVRRARRLARTFDAKYVFTVKFVLKRGFAENMFTTTAVFLFATKWNRMGRVLYAIKITNVRGKWTSIKKHKLKKNTRIQIFFIYKTDFKCFISFSQKSYFFSYFIFENRTRNRQCFSDFLTLSL